MSDLISRQAALDIVFDFAEAPHNMYQKIREQPTIEPKKGKWERHVLKNANVPWGYDCSACGAWFVVSEDTIEKYNYCPNCGAKMERSEE